MNWIKVLLINILLLFSFLGMILLAPPFIYSLYEWLTYDKDKVSYDDRSELKIYANIEWADKHFLEFDKLTTTYYDYISWRRDDFSGETININNGIRVTPTFGESSNNEIEYLFFGGSTTWGTGVNDINTYSSMFAKLTGTKVTNFGETGYIARQSLAYLNNYIIKNQKLDMKDVNVIFYDGVNDVAHRCRSEIQGLGTGRENQIQNDLKSGLKKRFSFMETFNQLEDFIIVSLQKFLPSLKSNNKSTKDWYDCTSDKKRAFEIANSLVDTWEVTSNIVKSHGGKFTAILQPVAYYGNPDVNYLNLTEKKDLALAAQYQAVYPLIIELATKRNFNFIDLTDIYDDCNECYIDFCHVGPQGNQILSSRLINIL